MEFPFAEAARSGLKEGRVKSIYEATVKLDQLLLPAIQPAQVFVKRVYEIYIQLGQMLLYHLENIGNLKFVV